MKTFLMLASLVGAAFLAGCGPTPVAPASVALTTPVQRSPWDGPSSHGVQLQTKNYAIYTTCRSDVVTILPAFMEASHQNYLKLTGLPDRRLDKPLPIYMMSTRDEWASLTKALLGPAAEKYLQIQSGGYCYEGQCLFWQLGGLATLSVAGHEGLHQYLHYRLADQLPMWLEEGLCTQAEAYEIQGNTVSFDPWKNLSRRGDLEGALMRGYWTPLEKLLPMDAGDALGVYVEKTVGYYGQLWALVRFLRSDPVYSASLDRMLADAEAGRFHQTLNVSPEALAELRLRGRIYNQTVSEKLFRAYFTDDLPAFEKQYKDFCQKLMRVN